MKGSEAETDGRERERKRERERVERGFGTSVEGDERFDFLTPLDFCSWKATSFICQLGYKKVLELNPLLFHQPFYFIKY